MRGFIAILITLVAVPCLAADEAHNWESCGFPWLGGTYRPRDIKSLDELPVSIREMVTRHILARVGRVAFADISFDRGQFIDVKSLHREYPESKRFQWRVPTYNLLYQFRLPGPGFFVACIELTETGSVIKELTLPEWGRKEKFARLTTLPEATESARRNGVITSDAPSELRYFRDTDTLEWVFEWKTWDDGLSFGGKRVHVPIQAPNQVHWSPWRGIR